MATYGLLFDYEYCTNCGSCIVSCKEEHGYPVGKGGISIYADGPWKINDKHWNLNYFPIVSDLCDLCADRVEKGKEPICVHHCQANIITYGTVEDLAKKLADKPKQFLIVPQFDPLTAKGAFVSKGIKGHQAAHIDVQATGEAVNNVFRKDSSVLVTNVVDDYKE